MDSFWLLLLLVVLIAGAAAWLRRRSRPRADAGPRRYRSRPGPLDLKFRQ